MIQRDNGLPGTTKDVTYLIESASYEAFFEQLLSLSTNLLADEYKLVEVKVKKGTGYKVYYVKYKSNKMGLR